MKKKKFNCPAELTVSLIGGKWKAILLYNLRKAPKGFGELKRLSPGITQATLTHQLREMQNTGLVKRKVVGKGPLPSVEYSLTSKGESLKPILHAMIRWGIENQPDYVIGPFGMDLRK